MCLYSKHFYDVLHSKDKVIFARLLICHYFVFMKRTLGDLQILPFNFQTGFIFNMFQCSNNKKSIFVYATEIDHFRENCSSRFYYHTNVIKFLFNWLQ